MGRQGGTHQQGGLRHIPGAPSPAVQNQVGQQLTPLLVALSPCHADRPTQGRRQEGLVGTGGGRRCPPVSGRSSQLSGEDAGWGAGGAAAVLGRGGLVPVPTPVVPKLFVRLVDLVLEHGDAAAHVKGLGRLLEGAL